MQKAPATAPQVTCQTLGRTEGYLLITKVDMMSMLLDACPSFEPTWQAFLDEWREEADDLPMYVALSQFARHLVGMLERGETARFPAIFAVVERLHLEGDDYVKTAATVGLLEDMQNGNLHKSTQPEQFRAFLGPVSEKWWDKLYRLWQHGELLTDE